MAKFLDATGLTYLWGKITAAFQPKITASGLLKGDGSGGVTAATSGTDYQAPITNNVTGSGTSGYIAKFNGGNTITNGPALGSETTTYLRNDGSWATPSNTTYSAGSGLSLSGTTFNHGSSITAGTAGTSSATSGSTLAVPYVTYNATGHVTAAGTHTHTVSGFAASSHAHGNITSGGDMTATAAIASGDRIVINDESASKLTSSTLTFGTGTTTFLANNGTWQTPVPPAVDNDSAWIDLATITYNNSFSANTSAVLGTASFTDAAKLCRSKMFRVKFNTFNLSGNVTGSSSAGMAIRFGIGTNTYQSAANCSALFMYSYRYTGEASSAKNINNLLSYKKELRVPIVWTIANYTNTTLTVYTADASATTSGSGKTFSYYPNDLSNDSCGIFVADVNADSSKYSGTLTLNLSVVLQGLI